MSQFFELHYHLPEDPARLFDVAQGLAGHRNILKRGGTIKVKPFTETCRRLLFQCIAFAVLTVLAAVLEGYSAIGIEVTDAYAALARERIENALKAETRA